MLLALALAVQVPTVRVNATVDRDRVPVGDEVTYTLRATSAAPGTFRVDLPDLAGLEVIDRTERIDDVVGARPAERVYQLDLTLRGAEVGSWRFAPVIVFVGNASEVAPEITIVVTGTASLDAGRNARVLDLIRKAPPPSPGVNATLAIVVSADRIYQGDQLDVLTAAWFPRSLRARLRRPPTLKPPVLAGVWSVPQPAIPGIVASRAVGDEVFDLFVSHQIAYPLTPGTLVIAPARLEYAVPMSRRASGDERAVEAASEPVSIAVVATPTPPAGFRGPGARNLGLGYRIRTLPAYAGEVLPVEITLTGAGNLAFWPPPNVTWPAGTRAYLDHTGETTRLQDGRLGGVKTFYFLLLPDSIGSVALPPLSYEFFDLADGRYRAAEAPGVVVPVLPARNPGPPRFPPELVAGQADWANVSTRLAPLGPWWWVLLFTPLTAVAAVLGWRWWRRGRPEERTTGPDGLAALEALVLRVVPEAERGHLEGIQGALRRAGVAAGPAREVADLKVDADWGRFAPGPAASDPSLGDRARGVVARIPAAIRRRVGIGALVLLAVAPLAGQTEGSPEQQYRSKAYGQAAAGFQQRASAQPDQWQHWYDLSAAEYLAGHDGAAAAALHRARGLAPRAAPVDRLWTTLERQYEPLRAVSHSRLSRIEWGLVAMAVWWTAMAMLLVRRLPRSLRGALVALGLVLVTVHAAAPRWTPEGFVASGTTLRRSPHGLAPESGSLGALTPVTIADRRPGWALVVDRSGNRGWIPATLVAEVGS